MFTEDQMILHLGFWDRGTLESGQFLGNNIKRNIRHQVSYIRCQSIQSSVNVRILIRFIISFRNAGNQDIGMCAL
jgi:hypothetical protein